MLGILAVYSTALKEYHKNTTLNNSVFEIVILPHHGITGKRIDESYKKLRMQYSQFDRIVILSPDHYGTTKNNIESLPNSVNQVCYTGHCVSWIWLSPYSDTVTTGGAFSDSWETYEHGIGEHILRIQTYFPWVPVTPIILQRELIPTKQGIVLTNTLANLHEKRVLIIVSVDFSHHVREDFARLHDMKTIDTLNTGTLDDFANIEVDCRNCLAVGRLTAIARGKPVFDLWDRTSVDTLIWSGSELENTSHIFWTFRGSGANTSSGIFLFAGDTHWARGFSAYENKNPNYFQTVLRTLYQKYNPSNDPRTSYHRLFAGFDDVVINLESAVADTGSCPKSGKPTQMSTDPKIFTKLSALGISMANIANNHSHDCGTKLFKESMEKIGSWGIIPFWYDTIAFRHIRGNNFAFIGIDTIEDSPDLAKINKTIQSLTASGYLTIVNIHWWIEYDSKHGLTQARIAHALVDAGARLIIGHHPHVIQDSEIYRWIPIYYSLGNFLFDQPMPETLEWLLVGCEISPMSTTCHDIPVYHDPKNYTIRF